MTETTAPLALVSPPDVEPGEEDGSKIVLFSLDGRDFLVDRNPSASILLRFLWNGKHDELAAVRDLLVSLLGEDAYMALMEWKPLTSEHLQQLMVACTNLLMGDRDPKGQRTGGGR